MKTIGFIGLGSQGGPMAERIAAAGYPLMVWARRPETTAGFVEKGAQAAASVEALAAACDLVSVCVVEDKGVLEICERLIPAMRPGALLAIHSTVLPETCSALASRCADRSIAFLDAPVSGGGPAAAAKSLTVMCGGDAEAFEAAKPVFEAFAKLIVRLGDVGAGQRAKIVNNALMAAHMGLAHAALAAAQELGVERAAFAALVAASSGRSFGFEVYARLPTPAAFSHGAPLLQKDVALLNTILRGDVNAGALQAAARPFLSAALGD